MGVPQRLHDWLTALCAEAEEEAAWRILPKGDFARQILPAPGKICRTRRQFLPPQKADGAETRAVLEPRFPILLFEQRQDDLR
jgi:hypothetical protein